MDNLSPNVTRLVRFLNDHGFITTDSGDGSNFEAGMECAVPEPMVAIQVDPSYLVTEAQRLHVLLQSRGVRFEDGPVIQATYDPHDQSSIILLLNVVDGMIGP